MSIECAASEHVPHRCLIKIRAVYDTLKKAEKKATDYILSHPKQIARTSIVEVAQEAGCSEATLVRLARKLGYDGYPELKKDLATGETETQQVLYRGITAQDDPQTVVQKVFAAASQSLQDTLGVLDSDHYARAVEALIGASKIMICGLGDAAQVAQACYQRFIRIDVNTLTAEDPDTQLIMASHLDKGDVLIAVSHSGGSTTILNVARAAQQRGAEVVAVTNYPLSPLAKASDLVLLTADFSEHWGGEVVSKRVSELCILESLYINYLILKNGEVLTKLRAANEAVAVHKL